MVVVCPDFCFRSGSLLPEDRELVRDMFVDEEGDLRPREEPDRFDRDDEGRWNASGGARDDEGGFGVGEMIVGSAMIKR